MSRLDDVSGMLNRLLYNLQETGALQAFFHPVIFDLLVDRETEKLSSAADDENVRINHIAKRFGHFFKINRLPAAFCSIALIFLVFVIKP